MARDTGGQRKQPRRSEDVDVADQAAEDSEELKERSTTRRCRGVARRRRRCARAGAHVAARRCDGGARQCRVVTSTDAHDEVVGLPADRIAQIVAAHGLALHAPSRPHIAASSRSTSSAPTAGERGMSAALRSEWVKAFAGLATLRLSAALRLDDRLLGVHRQRQHDPSPAAIRRQRHESPKG